MTNDSTLTLINRYRSPIMGFAALWIMFFHLWQPLFADGAPMALFYAENVTKRLGFEGVDIFFLLSGMGLTYSVGKHSLGGFYLRRFKRLALPFVAVAALRAVCERWGWRVFFFVVSGANFFVNSIYFFLWFVTAIAVLYLVFPLYWRLFSRARSKLVFTLAVIAAWYVLSLALKGTMREDMYGFTNRIPVFLTGVLLGWCAQNAVTLPSRRAVALIAAILAAAGLVLSFLCNFRGLEFILPVSNCCLPDFLTALGLTALLAELFARLDKGAARWINRALGFIGGISLEFYCVQEFLGGRTINVLSERVPDAAVNLAVLAAVNLAVLAVVTVSGWLLHRANDALWRGLERIPRKADNYKKSA